MIKFNEMPKINDIFWVIWYLYLSPNQQCNTTKGQKGLKRSGERAPAQNIHWNKEIYA